MFDELIMMAVWSTVTWTRSVVRTRTVSTSQSHAALNIANLAAGVLAESADAVVVEIVTAIYVVSSHACLP